MVRKQQKQSSDTKPKSSSGKSRKKFPDLVLETHRDLRGSIRAISQRFNDDPDTARMLLVNPLLALEDVGVRLTPELKEHIVDALRFPPNVLERRDQLELELFDDLQALGVSYRVPLTEAQRADLILNVLKLELPISKPRGQKIEPQSVQGSIAPQLRSREIRRLAKKHPLLAKLVEYERLRQGRVIFFPRDVYQRYKEGLSRKNWIKSVRFKV